jgi:hypothetical protein
VKPSNTWLNAHVGCLIPEQELLSMAPGQPPLSRWIAQMEISGIPWDRAKLAIACASGRWVTSVFFAECGYRAMTSPHHPAEGRVRVRG